MREAYHLVGREVGAQRDRTLELLRLVERKAQHVAEVVRYVVAAYGDKPEMLRPSVCEYRDACSAAANVYDRSSRERVLRRKHAERGCKRLYNEAVHIEPRAADAVHDVLYRRRRHNYRLHLDVEAHSVHAERVVDADIAVERVFDRYRVQYRLVRGDDDVCLRRVYDALDVEAHYGARRASERDHALRADARHLSAAEGDSDLADVLPYHVLRVADCLAHRLHCLVEVDDEPLADSVRRSLTDADYLGLVALGAALRDYDGDLARSQVEADEQVRFYIMTVA